MAIRNNEIVLGSDVSYQLLIDRHQPVMLLLFFFHCFFFFFFFFFD